MLLPSSISAKLINPGKSKTTYSSTQNIATKIANKTSKARDSIEKNTNINKNLVRNTNANDNMKEIYLGAEGCTASCCSNNNSSNKKVVSNNDSEKQNSSNKFRWWFNRDK
tara:strand:+ start:119 stop:451 length:333 start_codon:yes stop_codon:yes gene_type:complete